MKVESRRAEVEEVMKHMKNEPLGNEERDIGHIPSPRPSVVTVGSTATRSKMKRPPRIPIGTQGMPGTGLVPGMLNSASPTPVGSLGGPAARIAPILGGATLGAMGVGLSSCMGTAHPMVAEAIRASRVDKFTGRSEDFEEFERRWNWHLRLMSEASPGPLGDTVVLGTLRSYLDEASALMLESQLFKDPGLTYYKFWSDLKDKHMRDARTAHRQAWKAVRLQVSGSKLTLYDWNKFQEAYKAKRDKVEDWTDSEDMQYVFSQLPPELQTLVLRETNKKRLNKHWVRVVVPRGLATHSVMEEVAKELERPLTDAIMDKRNFIVQCKNDTEVRFLLEIDRSEIDGQTVRMQKADYAMSGDEIFDYVRRQLEQEDELIRLRQFMGCPADTLGPLSPNREVRVVQLEEVKPKPASGKEPKPKGGRGGRGRSTSPWKARADARAPEGKSSNVTSRAAESKPGPPTGRGKGLKGLKPGDDFWAKDCYTCGNLGLPRDHDFRECTMSKTFRATAASEPSKKQSKPVAPPVLLRPPTPPQKSG